jgi:hypothetical protein
MTSHFSVVDNLVTSHFCVNDNLGKSFLTSLEGVLIHISIDLNFSKANGVLGQ